MDTNANEYLSDEDLQTAQNSYSSDTISEEELRFMNLAIEEAGIAESEDEVPIGAVIVHGGRVIARAHNTREGSKCATHHAEILAIEEACRALGGWRLPDTAIYVTLEPCAMCAGAIINARIPKVVYGAPDIRFGAFGSLIDLSEIPLNHKPEIKRFVRREECKNLLGDYFRKKRKRTDAQPT